MSHLKTRSNVLPVGALPRGLSRVQAAAYIGVSTSTFDKMVRESMMPKPVRIYGRRVWDIRRLDESFAALDSEDAAEDPWTRMRT
jgi:hypothetical protein